MIPAAASSMIQMDSDNVQARLAYELAAKLRPAKDVFDQFGVSPAEAKALMANPQFQALYKEARAIWNSTDGTKSRIRAKAAMLVEDSLIEMYRMVHSVDTAPPAKIDAFKQIVAVADMAPKKEGGVEGPAFSITLNLGGEIPSQTLTLETAEIVDDGE